MFRFNKQSSGSLLSCFAEVIIIKIIMLFIVRLTKQCDVKFGYIQLMKLHVPKPWGSSSGS